MGIGPFVLALGLTCFTDVVINTLIVGSSHQGTDYGFMNRILLFDRMTEYGFMNRISDIRV